MRFCVWKVAPSSPSPAARIWSIEGGAAPPPAPPRPPRSLAALLRRRLAARPQASAAAMRPGERRAMGRVVNLNSDSLDITTMTCDYVIP